MGDAFEYHTESEGVNTPTNNTYVRITGKWFSSNGDTVYYQENKVISQLNNYPPSPSNPNSYWTSTNQIDTVEYPTGIPVDTLMPLVAAIDSGDFYDSPFKATHYEMNLNDTCYKVLSIQFGDVNLIVGDSTSGCFYVPTTEGYGTWTTYSVGFGETSYASYLDQGQGYAITQYYFQKGAEVCGNPLWLGIHELSAKKVNLHVSPNPAVNALTLKITNNGGIAKVKLQIMNVLGEQVKAYSWQQSGSDFKKQIDISTLSKGVYFIKAIIDGVPETVKFVKM